MKSPLIGKPGGYCVIWQIRNENTEQSRGVPLGSVLRPLLLNMNMVQRVQCFVCFFHGEDEHGKNHKGRMQSIPTSLC